MVKAELLFGALRSGQAEHHLQLLRSLFAPMHHFDFEDKSAEHYAQIDEALTAQDNGIGANDLIIAAIARISKAVLITHNTGEFGRVQELRTEDWEI